MKPQSLCLVEQESMAVRKFVNRHNALKSLVEQDYGLSTWGWATCHSVL